MKTYRAFTLAAAVVTLLAAAAAAEAATTTVVITSKTHVVNVHENDTVLFKAGTKQFTYTFDGNKTAYLLSSIAPPGTTLNNKIRVLVAPNPLQHQQGVYHAFGRRKT